MAAWLGVVVGMVTELRRSGAPEVLDGERVTPANPAAEASDAKLALLAMGVPLALPPSLRFASSDCNAEGEAVLRLKGRPCAVDAALVKGGGVICASGA